MGSRSVWPWILPFLVFTAFLIADGWFPDQHYAVYPFRVLAVGAVILWATPRVDSLRPSFAVLSALLGLVCAIIWIGLDPDLSSYPQPLIGRNPFALYSPGLAWLLFAFRLFGFAVIVPIMEELFWRGFLMRWLIKDDFTSVPLGTYKPFSFFVTTALFVSVHGAEWKLAVIIGLIFGAWFLYTKRLGDIMLTHGITNLAIGLYCLKTGDWHFLSIVAPQR